MAGYWPSSFFACLWTETKVHKHAKKGSCKRSHKLDGIGVGRIRTFPFSCDSAYDSIACDPVKTRLSESEAEAEEPPNHNAGNRGW